MRHAKMPRPLFASPSFWGGGLKAQMTAVPGIVEMKTAKHKKTTSIKTDHVLNRV